MSVQFFFSFLAHIQTTLDLPDLDFTGALRETTSRMEHMISTNRTGNIQNAAPAHSRTSSGSSSSVNGEVMQRSHTTLH